MGGASMSVTDDIIEHMFERIDDAALVDVIAATARASAVSDARRYAAIAELDRRNTCEHAKWACDDRDATAAEVAAALNIGHGRALGEIDLAVMLRDRLPKVAALFSSGQINARRVWLIDQRTYLVTDPEALTELDQAISERIIAWGPLSEYKLTQAIDVWVDQIDPGALRRTRNRARTRDFTITDADSTGTAIVYGRLLATDAALLEQRLKAMARGVCEDDPRTLAQRRADALGALGAGSQHLSCMCDDPACLPKLDDGRASSVVVHVVAERTTTQAQPDPQLNGEGLASEETPEPAEPETTPRKKAALIVGGGPVPAPLLADLIARGAKLRPVAAPKSEPEPRYRPSTALDEFVRTRDLTCRFPGCDRRATNADIDHTVPYPAGATHPGNLKCYCRIHHLIKTFWPGWADQQMADGTVVVTTPTGHTYTTKPGSSLFFPTWATPTPAPPGEATTPAEHCGLMMPKRKHTRSQTRAQRIKAERALNDAYIAERNRPPPF
jgi:hypothetical protein